MSVSFVDLKSQYASLEGSINLRIKQVMEHGKFIMGPEVHELEGELSKFVGTKHSISCSSGTDALRMALMVYGIGAGDVVFTTPFTFIASAEAIAITGAKPIFVDIDAKTKNISPEKLEKEVNLVKKEGKYTPKGILAVDLFGLPADYDALLAIGKKHELFLIEDAAQSFGATYMGRRAGSLAPIATTSFFPSKPLGCYGDGGAIFTDDEALAEHMKSLRVHGQGKNKYDNVRMGLNARLDTLQAAILLEKLKVFPSELQSRQRVASSYSSRLKEYVETPITPKDSTCAWAQYSILSTKRDKIREKLKAHAIPTSIYYETPLHKQPVFSKSVKAYTNLSVSESVAKNILSLPA